MTWVPAILAALSPVERLNALKSSPNGAAMLNWTVWAPMILAIVLVVVLVAIYRRWMAHRRSVKAFALGAEQLGLDAEEQAVLARVVSVAGLRDPAAVYESDAAFNQGLQIFMAGHAAAGMSNEAKARLAEIVWSLREKLGFREAPQASPGRPAPLNIPIPAGSNVSIERLGADEPVRGTVIEAGEEEIIVRVDEPLQSAVGEVWRLRYLALATQWEFDVAVKEVMSAGVRLRLRGNGRAVNHRRFVRAATDRSAHFAPFPFMHEPPEGELLRFVAGTLTEIGGPGLRIQSPVCTQPGDRVLVLLQMGESQVIQGSGTVRRCTPDDGGAVAAATWTTVVELTGLSDAEVGRLVCETNHAARQAAGSGPFSEQPGKAPDPMPSRN